MKKLTSIVIILAIALSLCLVVLAADGETETKDDFVYLKGTNTITEYVGITGICEIPENAEVKGLQKQRSENPPITKLIVNKGVVFDMELSGELHNFSNLKEIELKNGITEIPDNAFKNCNSLEKITIPSTVTEIGNFAISNCKALKTVELPNGIRTIGEYAFSYLPSLSGNITIPDSVTSMGEGAFSYCGDLGRVHLSDNLTYKATKNYNGSENYAKWFDHTNVKEINIPDAMLDSPTCYFNADEITFNSDMTVAIYTAVRNSSWYINSYLKGKTDKSMGDFEDYSIVENTVLKYIGTDKNPTVPSGIKTIGEAAFSYCDIDKVELPETLEKIEEAAFYWSTIKNITIPKNVKSIGNMAFDTCPYLEKITVEGTPEIGLNAIVVTNTLTEENITADKVTLQKILENGTAEYDDLTSFYDILNKQRKIFGFGKIEVPKNRNLSHATTAPSEIDNPETTTKPQTSAKPSETPVPQTISVQSGDKIGVNVNDKAVTFSDAQPFIDDNDRTQVPIRAVAEMLDCTVDWDGETKTVTVTRWNGDIVNLVIGSNIMTVNGEQLQMDTAAIIKDDRTYIPVRFVAEAVGYEVDWIKSFDV